MELDGSSAYRSNKKKSWNTTEYYENIHKNVNNKNWN